jgi:hypothetical protein
VDVLKPKNDEAWVMRVPDVPGVADLVDVSNDKVRWLNLHGMFRWRAELSPDEDSSDSDRRELWLLVTGYLLRRSDQGRFMKWAQTVNFWGDWMPKPPSIQNMFLGEHVWSDAARYFARPYYGDPGWKRLRKNVLCAFGRPRNTPLSGDVIAP